MTVQVRCIRPFSQYDVGDTAEVPDGAEFDPFHWEPAPAATPAEPAEAVVPRLPYPVKEM